MITTSLKHVNIFAKLLSTMISSSVVTKKEWLLEFSKLSILTSLHSIRIHVPIVISMDLESKRAWSMNYYTIISLMIDDDDDCLNKNSPVFSLRFFDD